MTAFALVAIAIGGCSGTQEAITPANRDARDSVVHRDAASATGTPSAGMCTTYAGFGTDAFCYEMGQGSGTVLTDSSGNGRNGTISSTGITYQAPGLAAGSSVALETDGSTGFLTSGYSPTSGSFSFAFFVNLLANAENSGTLVSTVSGSTGFSIVLDTSDNKIVAKVDYSGGQTAISSGAALPLNVPEAVVLTYNSSTRVATLCEGNTSTPTCTTATLPSAYVASSTAIVYGGGTKYAPQKAVFDASAFFQGLVLTASQIDTVTASTDHVAPTPTPSPSPDVYNPSAQPLFPGIVFTTPIPSMGNITPNPQTSAWCSKWGGCHLAGFHILNAGPSASPTSESDLSAPIYVEPQSCTGIPTCERVTIDCTYAGSPKNYGACNFEGKAINIDTRWVPEDGKILCNSTNIGSHDCHLAIIEQFGSTPNEMDFWGTPAVWPSAGGTLSVRYGGECNLSGTPAPPGFSSSLTSGTNPWCAAVATRTPLTYQALRLQDLVAAANSGGVMNHAIGIEVECNGGPDPIAPFKGTDGSGNACAQEGSLVYLNLTDAQVKSMCSCGSITLALLETVDKQHYGMYTTDTDSSSNMGFLVQSDFGTTVYGLSGYNLSTFIPLAQQQGIATLGSDGRYSVTPTYASVIDNYWAISTGPY